MPIENRFEEINAELNQAAEKVRTFRLLSSRLRKKKQGIVLLENRCSALEESTAKELKDVKRLEGGTFARFIHEMIGNRDEKLDKEKKEHLAVKLKLDAVRLEMQTMGEQIAGIEKELAGIGDPTERYSTLLEGKAALLRSNNDELAVQWKALNGRLEKVRGETEEIEEAIQAGRRAADELGCLGDALRSATNWGLFDIVGGGIVAELGKHNQLDEAMFQAATVQMELANFGRELNDVGIPQEASVEIRSFNSFTDWFFDGLIVDLSVQSDINDSLQEVENAGMHVVGTITKLKMMLKERLERVAVIERQLEVFVFTAE